MVLSIIFLEDKHNILLHLSIFYEYQQFFQNRICFSMQPPDYSDPWPRLARFTSFFLIMLFNNVSNLYNNSVVEKINGMAYIFTLLMFRKPNKTTINKNKMTNFHRSTSFRFSFIFRYFKVFQVKRIVYI